MGITRRTLLAAGAANALFFADGLRLALPDRPPEPARDAESHPRIVVLGPDGVDHRLLTRLLDEDASRPASERLLPNLGRLREDSGLHRLRSEIPPESPVAWASLLTGVNPGRHGIFDFVRPGPGYRPENGLVDYKPLRLMLGTVPIRRPVVRSRLAAPTFVERIYKAGYPVLSLRQPLLFPAPDLPGARMLSGLGTPDVAGTAGIYTVWSDRRGFTNGETMSGGIRVALERGRHRHDTHLEGPFDPSLPKSPWGGEQRAKVPLRFEVTGARQAVSITLAGRKEEVELGQRSGYFKVTFPYATTPEVTLTGHVRFEVKSLAPLLVLADPVNFYAPRAPVPITSPKRYGRDLWNRYGPFETGGWREQTFQLNDRFQDDEGFLRDLLDDLDRDAEILLGEIKRGGKCVFQVFTATDRALHGFYRYLDPDHPARRDGLIEGLEPFQRVLQRIDEIVGQVRALLDPEDLLLVCSDHGFETWRWAVNLNRWLVNQGYMHLRENAGGAGSRAMTLTDLSAGGGTAGGTVDWSRTRAYALGLGQVYLNLRGREEQGIVEPGAEADALVASIREGLLALRNPFEPDDRPVRSVTRLRDVLDGPLIDGAAEMQVGFAAGYRVSLGTVLLAGQTARDAVFEENAKPWSGDHASSDVDVVPGLLLANRPIAAAPAGRPHQVRDIAATALAWFGLDTSDLDGRPLPL